MSALTKFAIGLIVGMALGLLIILNEESVRPSKFEAPSVLNVRIPNKGTQALDFDLSTLDGGHVALSDYRGRIVLLNFWATWCNPCTLEMPVFARYAQEFNQNLVVLGINMQEPANVVEEFVQARGIPYPILLDPRSEVAAMYQVTGLPTTYIIDNQGIIHAVHVGYMQEVQLIGYLKELGLVP